MNLQKREAAYVPARTAGGNAGEYGEGVRKSLHERNAGRGQGVKAQWFDYIHAAAVYASSVIPLFVPHVAEAVNILAGLISSPIGELGSGPRPNAFNWYGRVCTLSHRRRERSRAVPQTHRQWPGKDPG